MRRVLARSSDYLDLGCQWAATGFFIALLIIVIFQVVTRYILQNAPVWTEEVARIHELPPTLSPSVTLGVNFFHGAHRQAIERALAAAVAEGRPYDLELELISASGRWPCSRWLASPRCRSASSRCGSTTSTAEVIGSTPSVLSSLSCSTQLMMPQAG